MLRLSVATKANPTWRARWLVAVPLFIASAAHAEAVPDTAVEVPNGGFEAADTEPWETYGDVVEVTGDGCSEGTRCLRLGIAAGAANNEAGVYQDVVIASPRSVRLSTMLAVDEALSGDTIVELKIELPEGDGHYAFALIHNGATPAGSSERRDLCVDVVGAQGVARPVVTVRSPTGTGTGVVRVDGFTLTTSLSSCSAAKDDDGDGGCAGGLGFAPLSLLLLALRRRS